MLNDIQRILVNILTDCPATRAELVTATGIPRTTIFDNLRPLFVTDEVATTRRRNGKRGRPITIFYVPSVADYYGGIEYGLG